MWFCPVHCEYPLLDLVSIVVVIFELSFLLQIHAHSILYLIMPFIRFHPPHSYINQLGRFVMFNPSIATEAVILVLTFSHQQ